jgi:hypothetical protein
MLTSDREGWGAAGVPGAAEELEKISTGRKGGWASDPCHKHLMASFKTLHTLLFIGSGFNC